MHRACILFCPTFQSHVCIYALINVFPFPLTLWCLKTAKNSNLYTKKQKSTFKKKKNHRKQFQRQSKKKQSTRIQIQLFRRVESNKPTNSRFSERLKNNWLKMNNGRWIKLKNYWIGGCGATTCTHSNSWTRTTSAAAVATERHILVTKYNLQNYMHTARCFLPVGQRFGWTRWM